MVAAVKAVVDPIPGKSLCFFPWKQFQKVLNGDLVLFFPEIFQKPPAVLPF